MDRPEAIRISQFDKVHMDTGGLYQKKKKKGSPWTASPHFSTLSRTGPVHYMSVTRWLFSGRPHEFTRHLPADDHLSFQRFFSFPPQPRAEFCKSDREMREPKSEEVEEETGQKGYF